MMQVNYEYPPRTAWTWESPRASKFFRLHPLETYAVFVDSSFRTVVTTPAATHGMTSVVCSGGDEIVRLIRQRVLVPDIVSDKEYEVQLAVGAVDHRTYRLRSEIAAKYLFSYNTYMTLMMIENLIVRCDYNIFDDLDRLQRLGGQKYLEIIPRDGTVVRDYQGNIITEPTNEMHYVTQFSFDDMVSRGIIVLQGPKWKLSRNYWEFRI